MACETIKQFMTDTSAVRKSVEKSGTDDELNWKDSNVGKIGSDEDKAVRKNAAEKETEWLTAGQKPGIEVWRIEAFMIKPVEKESYGKFHEGDSYIVLHTKETEGGKFTHNIHFLIGKESTADEYGTAAYKTVELDDFFGGEPIEYREHQEEGISPEFEALFQEYGGIEWLPGGFPSGMKHVLAEHTKVLYHVRNHKGVLKVFPVPLLKSSVNSDDCFILDAKEKIIVYNGPTADDVEKEAARRLVDEIETKRVASGMMVGSVEKGTLRKFRARSSISNADVSQRKFDEAFWEELMGEYPAWYKPVEENTTEPVPVPEEKEKKEAEPGSVPTGQYYPLEVLQKGCPEGVQPNHKEQALSDEDFKATFKMTKEEFSKLAGWKQQGEKKKVNLF